MLAVQKDVHLYVTYVLAKKAGLAAQDADKLAWTDQLMDDLTEPDLDEIQTQVTVTVGVSALRRAKCKIQGKRKRQESQRLTHGGLRNRCW